MTDYDTGVCSIPFDQGWTLDIRADLGGSLYLDWNRTGSQDAHLSDMLPLEAREFAAILLKLADYADASMLGNDGLTDAARAAYAAAYQEAVRPISTAEREAIKAWRDLQAAKKLQIRKLATVDRVVSSMAMSGEPVSEEWIRANRIIDHKGDKP